MAQRERGKPQIVLGLYQRDTGLRSRDLRIEHFKKDRDAGAVTTFSHAQRFLCRRGGDPDSDEACTILLEDQGGLKRLELNLLCRGFGSCPSGIEVGSGFLNGGLGSSSIRNRKGHAGGNRPADLARVR